MQIPAKIISNLQKNSICVLGLGQEGLSTYRFLRWHLPEKKLTIADQKKLEQLPAKLQAELNADTKLSFIEGETRYLSNLNQFDVIFKTPGIPLHLPQIQEVQQQGVVISSNLQLFFEIIEAWKQKLQSKLEVGIDDKSSTLLQPITIGVTGTKGKSTTTALIHHVLSKNGQDSVLVGNIGQPALDRINQITSKGKLVIELSSHQLDQLKISPDIAVIQRVVAEHLDYYPNPEAYYASKQAITKYQKVNQYVIYNPQWQHTRELATLSQGKKLTFQLNSHHNSDILVYVKSYYLTYRDSKHEDQIITLTDIPLLGKHNLNNVAPAIIVGKLLGLSGAQIGQAMHTFKPLPHRLEKVTEKNGILYVNDSLATMPDAAIAALETFKDRPVILLAGGHERHQDYSGLASTILKNQIKALALFPENGRRLQHEVEKQAQALNQSAPPSKIVQSMPEAFEFIQQHVQAGDVVLLSPGAASFGVFKNYKDRGEQFCQLAQGA
jgi:UDP-N-acetylmuramoylalanine--D-glutamate ligase